MMGIHAEEIDDTGQHNLLMGGLSGDNDLLDGDRSLFKTGNSGGGGNALITTGGRGGGQMIPNHQIGTFLASRNPLETQTNQTNANIGGLGGAVDNNDRLNNNLGSNMMGRLNAAGTTSAAPEEIRAEIELEQYN